MTDKRALLEELLPLMERNGADAAHLAVMREPEWQARVTVENLQFLLQQHRELAALRQQNAGLYERWQQSKQPRGPDPH